MKFIDCLNKINWLLWFLIIVVCFQHYLIHNKNENLQQENEKLYQTGIEILRKKDDLGRELLAAQAFISENSKANQKLLKEIDELKSLKSKVVLKTQTKFDTLTLMLRDTIVLDNFKDSIYQKTFSFNDQWLTIQGRIEDYKMVFDSLIVRNDYNIETGIYKKNLFSKKQQTVFVKSSNPHTTTNEVKSYILEDKRKWYEKGFPKIAAGALAGFIIARQIK